MEAFPTYTLSLQRQINPWRDQAFAERYVEALRHRGRARVRAVARKAAGCEDDDTQHEFCLLLGGKVRRTDQDGHVEATAWAPASSSRWASRDLGDDSSRSGSGT